MNDDEPKVFSSSAPVSIPAPAAVEPPLPNQNLNYAPWMSRVGASILDGTVEFLILLVLSLVFGVVVSLFISTMSQVLPSLANWGDLNDPETSLFARAIGKAFFILSFSISFFNRVFIQWYYAGSIGKRIVGLELMAENGGAVSFWRVFARYIATWFSPVLFGIGYLMPLWMPKRQAFHDYICKTIVVTKPQKEG